jgi:hypothetical protein
MKTGIKRIEQTLRTLEQPVSDAQLTSNRLDSIAVPSLSRSSSLVSKSIVAAEYRTAPSPSFDILSSSKAPHSVVEKVDLAPEEIDDRIQQFPKLELQDIHLPKPKSVPLSPHRNAPNPALASSLLQDMLTIVTTWQQEHATIVQTIQTTYSEGAILDGWLESLGTPSQDDKTQAFRHADISQLVSFVEKLQTGKIQPQDIHAVPSNYRLCGINPDGQLWSYPCPPDQVPAVSMAIARHHKLRQLRIRQADLETRLTHFSEDLVRLHSQLKD